jgi:long-chain acyl-CoA synthetase
VLGERIHALLVLRAGATLDLPSLKKFLANKLEKFKQPDAYYVLDALPLGRTGKADRGQFKSLIAAGSVTPLRHPD